MKLIDELDLLANAGDVVTYLKTYIKHVLADHAHIGDICGERMIYATEFVKDKDSRTFFDAADKIGPQVSFTLLSQDKVIARAMPQGDILAFAPQFCLTRQEVDTVVAAPYMLAK